MRENKIKYKVLQTGQISPYQEFKFRRRHWYHEPKIGQKGTNGCHIGLYATDVEGLLFRGVWRDNETVYRCKVKGRKAGEAPMKTCYEYLQVMGRVPDADIKQLARDAETRLGYHLAEALYPIDPRLIEREQLTPTNAEIELLEQYIKVMASAGYSAGYSVEVSIWASNWAYVGSSVWSSVWFSVGNSVKASVGSSVWTYVGSLFPQIEKWKYVDHEQGAYPFQAGADLWRAGLVPSYDGKVWRLHAGQKMEMVFKDS